ALARERGVRIFDARRPPANLPVADGLAAEVDAYVVHTVGSDCNVGKMTAQVELRNALIARGHRTRFVATGQTGIFIEGWGIAVDAVVADFIAGASECLVLEAAKDADIILVEGQARDAVARAADETGLPATDPVRFGSAPLVDAIIQGAMAAK